MLGLMRMGTMDTARRMRLQHQLTLSKEALETRVVARTVELESLNADLRREIGVRHEAEVRTLMQLERLELLRRITHSISERHDLESIFQVAVRSIEEHLPADFAALCVNSSTELIVSRIGARSEHLALELAMSERARIPIDENGLGRCLAGEQVYEADLLTVDFPFPRRLARGGLRSLVMVPLRDERAGVFAVLVVARRAAQAFSSGECEFLRQLCDHVALAANQAQLHASLQQAYEELRRTQDAVLEQERLRAGADGERHRPRHQHAIAVAVASTRFSSRRASVAHAQAARDRAARLDDVAHTVRAWASSIGGGGTSRARAGEGGPRVARSSR
jgi:GAF domain-containing protein